MPIFGTPIPAPSLGLGAGKVVLFMAAMVDVVCSWRPRRRVVERLVGKAVREFVTEGGGSRDELTIITKVGVIHQGEAKDAPPILTGPVIVGSEAGS